MNALSPADLARYGATLYAAPDLARRASDELLLSLLAMRRDGVKVAVVAERTGLTPAWVRANTGRARRADEAESGETVADLAPHYWPAPAAAAKPPKRRKFRNVRAGW